MKAQSSEGFWKLKLKTEGPRKLGQAAHSGFCRWGRRAPPLADRLMGGGSTQVACAASAGLLWLRAGRWWTGRSSSVSQAQHGRSSVAGVLPDQVAKLLEVDLAVLQSRAEGRGSSKVSWKDAVQVRVLQGAIEVDLAVLQWYRRRGNSGVGWGHAVQGVRALQGARQQLARQLGGKYAGHALAATISCHPARHVGLTGHSHNLVRPHPREPLHCHSHSHKAANISNTESHLVLVGHGLDLTLTQPCPASHSNCKTCRPAS